MGLSNWRVMRCSLVETYQPAFQSSDQTSARPNGSTLQKTAFVTGTAMITSNVAGNLQHSLTPSLRHAQRWRNISYLPIYIYIYIYTHTHTHTHTHRVFQEECARLREGVSYVKVYRYNPKHLCPMLNGYGDNDQRKVWSSGGSTHCTCQLTSLVHVYHWVWCPLTESQLTLAISRLIPECAVSHVTSLLAFMCHL